MSLAAATGVSATEASNELSLRWVKVNASGRHDILDMLMKQLQGNYERIRTVKAKYSIQQEQPVSKSSETRVDKAANAKGRLTMSTRFDMTFAIDMKTGNIYRSKDNSEVTWLREGSREPVSFANAKVINERSIVTTEHYMHFNEKNVVPELSALPGNPRAMRKRVAYIDTTQFAEQQHLGDMPDIRLFYAWGQVMPWVALRHVATLPKDSKDFDIYEAAGSNGASWYRLTRALADEHYLSIVFDPEHGMSPVSHVLALDESGQKPRFTQRWRWANSDGIYVPAEAEVSIFEEGKRTTHRKATLQSCTFNSSLDAEQFSYQALGIKNDDIVVDNINKQVLVAENDKLVKLADFGEEYILPSETKWAMSYRRKVIMLVVLTLLLAGLVVSRWYRKKSRAAAH
jgi:hypothetical protein